MIDGARITVVVPAFNEQQHIADVLLSMPDFVDRVIVVDDASRDATVPRARSAGASAAARRADDGLTVEVIRHRRNQGVGAAITSGYRRAMARGADCIAVMAGDGQMHPDDLRPLLQPLLDGSADYSKGDRLSHPSVWRRMPPTRMLGSFLFSELTGLALGVELRDTQCGYTAVNASALAQLDLARVWPGYGYPNDLLGALHASGARIAHVTVRPVYADERSGLGLWHVPMIAGLCLRVGWRRAAQQLRSGARTARS
jgi:glycosyltransferase involved in cell wall biosynthesis